MVAFKGKLVGLVLSTTALILSATASQEFSQEIAAVDTETYKIFARQLATDDFTYTNANDTYSPNSWVKYGHMLSGREFGSSMEYLQRVLYAPVGLFALGFLAMFFLDFGLLFRCCCNCCKCEPDRKGPKYKYNRNCNFAWFYILCLLVLIFDMLVFIGNTEVDKGVATTSDTVVDAQLVVDSVYDGGVSLTAYGVDMLSEIAAANITCPAKRNLWTDMTRDTNDYSEQVTELTSQMKDIYSNLDDVNDKIDLYAVYYRSIGMWVVWGLSILSVLLFLISHCCNGRIMLQLSMFFAQLTFLIYIALGVLWCLFVSLFGDLCMDPSYNIIKNVPMEEIQDIATYYSTCVGTSILQGYVNESWSELHNLNNSLSSAYQACPNDVHVAELQDLITNAYNSLNGVETDLSCPPLQTMWFSILNDGLCTEMYTGYFYIWGSQLITSFLLFCLVLTAAYTHQFYPNKGIAPGDDDEDMDAAAGNAADEDEDNDFVNDYKKQQAANNNPPPAGKQEQGHQHKVVDKNHHMPHQVQVQEAEDDDDEFFM